MCGIAGIIDQTRPQEELAAEIAVMTEVLRHRGPDDGGVLTGPGWALGARRLAIQDLSAAGAQPMVRNGLTLVYNGEVYNFRELRRELEVKAHRFRSMSDTEVVLAAFEDWGTEAFARFNGMFALAILDEGRRRLWFARDRWGKKPLFVARLRRRLVFASELKAIMAVARGELTTNRAALAKYFRYQYVPGTGSIFTEVEKVAPASWVEIDVETLRARAGTFWSLPDDDEGSPATPEELLDVVREAVRRRLIADVPVGAFLSGGTDSSLVTACMHEAAPECRTFSIGFEDSRFDESTYALAVARELGTEHTHHVLREREALDLVTLLPTVFDEPFADSSALPQLAVSRLAREGVTVVLSGDGGDELFGGYLRYRAHRYLNLAARLPRALASLAPLITRLPKIGRRLGLFATLAGAESPGGVYRELVSVWKTPELQRLMPDADQGDDAFTEEFATGGNGGLVELMMRTDARTYLVDDILQKVDRASMAVSLESRNPLLDPAVAEVAFRSVSTAEQAPAEKLLLRATLRLVLPDRLVDRPKKGFAIPVGEWMRSELRSLVDDLVLSRGDAEYDLEVAKATCREHLNGTNLTHQTWSLVAYELWRRRWQSSSGDQ
jgi:asparagine synthase (glutamine-hydrolysing)